MTTYQEKQNACVNQLYSDLTNMDLGGVHNCPKKTSKKDKMGRHKGPRNIIQGMLPMSTTEYTKLLRQHSLDIIGEAKRTLLTARVRAEGIMESKATEQRFSEQERVNLEGMYQGSVEEAARKKKFEQDVSNDTFTL